MKLGINGDYEIDSVSSTPYTSAPSSPPACAPQHFFFSAPSSPTRSALCPFSSGISTEDLASTSDAVFDDFEFEFSARSMISADEIFLNGQILPMTLCSEENTFPLNPPSLPDGESWDRTPLQNRSLRRRTRSLSPERNAPFVWQTEEEEAEAEEEEDEDDEEEDDDEEEEERTDINTKVTIPDTDLDLDRKKSETLKPPISAWSTSRNRNQKRWIFLKHLLHRSKSEGSGNTKDKFWHNISFSPSKDRSISLSFFSSKGKPKDSPSASSSAKQSVQEMTYPTKKTSKNASKKVRNGVGIRRRASAHERKYIDNRAQTEEMRRKTFLPHRQGMFLGCLEFSSRSCGAMNGFARNLNTVASR